MNGTYFQWDRDLITGLDIVDSQHQGLVKIINDSLQLCFKNEKIDEAMIGNIHDKLTSYVVEHFETEEKLMKERSVDSRHVGNHYLAHSDFKSTVEKFFVDPASLTDPIMLADVIEFLIRWLAYHILYMDKSMARQISLMDDGMSSSNAYEKEQNLVELSTEPLLKALKALFYLVSEKNKELERANHELEDKVRLRTLELEDANKKLERLSMMDELTGLPNRRYAMSQIDQLINSWTRYGEPFSLLFIDVDKFKAVNDNYGHKYGDKVLKWIAEFLEKSLRKSDIPCRLGGDEFLVICAHCDASEAVKIADMISEKCKKIGIEHPLDYWKPSLSIGIAEMDISSKSASDLLKKADDAMYKVKKNGGGAAELSKLL